MPTIIHTTITYTHTHIPLSLLLRNKKIEEQQGILVLMSCNHFKLELGFHKNKCGCVPTSANNFHSLL